MPVEGRKKKKIEQTDPLYRLFEHFLFTKTYEDSSSFTKEVATQYLAYLDATSGFIPFHSRKMIQEDVESEIHEMLVRKIYGITDEDESMIPEKIPSLTPPNKPSRGDGEPY
jgi:hypothetical protein